MVTPTSGADAWLRLNNVPLRFHEDNENWDAQASEYERNILRITPHAPDDLQIQIGNELLETERYGRWYWRPRGYAGLYELKVSIPDNQTWIAKVRVFPEKLSYTRYKIMLNDISSIMEDTLFRLHSSAQEKVITQNGKKDFSALKEYFQIKAIVEELMDIITCIHRQPHSFLQTQSVQRPFSKVHRFTSHAVPIMATTFPITVITGNVHEMLHLPNIWIERSNNITHDVYENRLLKHFILHQLIPRLNFIEKCAMNELKIRRQDRTMKLRKHWRDDETPHILALDNIVKECHHMTKQCMFWCNQSFLQSVKPLNAFGRVTQVLLKNPDYSRFHRLYLRYQDNLRISLNIEQYLATLSIRKMSEIYEIWAIFSLTEIIVRQLKKNGYQVTSTTLFFQVEKDLFQAEVQKNVSSIIFKKGDSSVNIKYEPRYYKFTSETIGFASISHSDYLMPDMAIEIYNQGIPQKLIIFDPKYRSENINGSIRFLEDDVNKMRFYRDKLCIHQKNSGQTERAVSSAYILYPGEIFDHEPRLPEVGALPLIPDMPLDKKSQMEDAIIEILIFSGLLSTYHQSQNQS